MSQIRVFVFTRRHPSLALQQYKSHYENTHVPLLRQISGDTFPISHTRHYIPRSPDKPNSAILLMGQGDFDFDCMTEAVYADQEHLQRHMMEIGTPEKTKLREDDEEKFLDRGSIRILRVESEGS